ncbi:hypothetical protein AKO1_013452 [Acrasis kona]|uniref:Protein kinase domain-containing protein n=1 Tax=Acrasis kona TaxID=1008807 RepID=A0AAW2ZGR5_9EUKA
MGNQLYKDYSFDENPVASGGPSFLWKVYSGQNKNTREEVSIFICHIKDIEARFGKNNVPQVLNHFRREAAVLTKIRHPLVLNPIQPLIETRTELAMITEPVLGSVSNLLLKRYTHITNVTPAMEKYELHNLEMKFGMCQVMEALAFCHQNTHLVHGNVTPHQIFITPKGQWKLSGFHFSFHSDAALDRVGKGPLATTSAQASPSVIPPEYSEIVHFGNSISKSNFLPSLDYAAPEYVLNKAPSFCSDIFSFGLLYCQLLRANGRTHGRQSVPDDGDDDSSTAPVNTTNNPSMPLLNTYQNVEKYNSAIRRLQDMLGSDDTFNRLSAEVFNSLMGVCSLEPSDRPTAHFILSHCELLFGMEVKALRYLNNMEMREQVKKAQFLRSLYPMIKPTSSSPSENVGFPDRILFQRVLPPLLEECKDVKMTLYALPNVLAIGERMSNPQFGKLILPTLCKYVLMYTDQQAKVPAIVLQNFDLLWSKSTVTEQKNFLIPFLVRCLQSSQQDVQIEAMKRSEEWLNSDKLSISEFKTIVLPDLQSICKKTNNPVVRVNGVVCLGKILSRLDRPVIVSVIVPVLEHILKTDQPNVTCGLLMSCVGVFLKITKQLEMNTNTIDLISQRILPAILPIASQRCLDRDAFGKYIKAVKNMLDVVERERINDFETGTNEEASPSSQTTNTTLTESEMESEISPVSPMANEAVKKPIGNVDPLQRIVMEKNQDEEVMPMQRRVVNFNSSIPSSSTMDENVNEERPSPSSSSHQPQQSGAFDSLLGRFMIDDSSSSTFNQPSSSSSLFKSNKSEKSINIDDLMMGNSFANIDHDSTPKSTTSTPSFINPPQSQIESTHEPLHRDVKEDSFDRMLNRINTQNEEKSNQLFTSNYQNESNNVVPERERSQSSMETIESMKSLMSGQESNSASSAQDFDSIQNRYSDSVYRYGGDDDGDEDEDVKVKVNANKPSTSGDMFDSLLMRHIDSDED